MFIKCFYIFNLLYHYCHGLDIISDEYDDSISYGEVIQGWHHFNEVHHVLREERPISNINHDTYDQLTLRWPTDANSNHGEITFLKCTNRTPCAAKAVMHVTEGGVGARSFTLHVMFTSTGISETGNWMILCHIYTSIYDQVPKHNSPAEPTESYNTNLLDFDIMSNITVEY